MSKINNTEQGFSMKILIFVLTLFLIQPANAFDESEYRMIDLRKRSYAKGGTTELQKNPNAKPSNSNLTSQQPPRPPSNNAGNLAGPSRMQPTNYNDIPERKIKKRIQEDDDMLTYDRQKDAEVKEYIKNNPQVLPDV